MDAGVDFFYEHLGRHLSDAPPEKSGKAAVPTWLGKNDEESVAKGKGLRVGSWPLGAKIPAFYIITPGHAILIGKVALENSSSVTFRVSSEAQKIDGRREIARWLVNEAKAPFMVGVITEANPNASFTVSMHSRRSYFCESSGVIGFDLEAVREDVKLLDGLPWKEVAVAIYRYDEFRNAEMGSPEKENAKIKLMQSFKRLPQLQAILQKLHSRPRSGEMEILRLVLS